MRKSKKIVSLLLATMLVGGGTLAGCNKNGNEHGNATVITIMNTGGGVGRAWLDQAIKRFKAARADHSYEEGKMGVSFEVEHNMSTSVATMATSGYNIYFDAASPTTLSLAAQNSVLCIDDIVKEKIDTRDGKQVSIEDKINVDYRAALKGADDKYYSLPHFALYSGLTYNVDLFEKANLYLAAPDQSGDKVETEDCDYGTFDFAVLSKGGKKSCGNDGEYGTYDDGLPTTLKEFFVLCNRMSDKSIEPVHFSGKSNGYVKYFFDALWTSLSGGYEAAATRYTYTGNVECLTGYSEDEDAFEGIDYIKKPLTETQKIDRSTGYLANDNVARYYACATLEVLEEEGWFSGDSETGTVTHIDAMYNFIFSGKGKDNAEKGMFIEGDYWYNEARDNDVIEEYELVTKDKNRRVAWMPLPTAVDEVVTEGNGREYCMINETCNYAFINANISDNKALVDACKDFLQFCYTDAELSHFTGCTGVSKAGMNYDVLEEDEKRFSYFNASVIECRNDDNTKIVDAYKDALYNANIDYPTLASKKYNGYLNVLRSTSYGTKDIFEATRTKENGWGVENL